MKRVSLRSAHRAVALVLLGAVSGACLPNGPMKIEYNDRPEQLDDGWTVGRPEEVGIDPAALRAVYERFFSEDEFFTSVSLLVVRHGQLVAEGYLRDLGDRDRVLNIQSSTKSFTALTYGVLESEQASLSRESTLFELIPWAFSDDDPAKRQITIEHLLTMRSGIDFDNAAFSIDTHPDALRGVAELTLSKPMYAPPGEEFYYRDADPALVAISAGEIARERFEEAIRRAMFGPMGIEDYRWDRTGDGDNTGAYGLWMRPRDEAKVGLMLVQGGQWEGQQLVPPDYLAAATRKQTDSGDRIPEAADFDYGYFFWIVPELQAFTTWGHGGNFIFVVPAADLVIVHTALPYAGFDAGASLPEFVPVVRSVLDAITDL
jgi:CubicO group peptidase (beta-lactamase class C family)